MSPRFAGTAAREIIVCAGAINSPKLLMLSGVGPAHGELAQHGIDIVHDLPGVGENLMDHQLACRSRWSASNRYRFTNTLNPVAQALRSLLRWLARSKTAFWRNNHFECGAFIRSEAGVKYPGYPVLPVSDRWLWSGSKDFMKTARLPGAGLARNGP